MNIIFDLPTEIHGINYKNIIIPYSNSIYKVKYSYYTVRNNNRKFEKYIICSDKAFKSISHSIVDCAIYNILQKNSNGLLERAISEAIIKPYLLKSIDNFNTKYSYRQLVNVQVEEINKVCEADWVISKNKIKLDLNCLQDEEINFKQLSFIYDLIEFWKVSLNYKTFRGNVKTNEKIILRQKSNRFDLNEIFNSLEEYDNEIEDLIQNHYRLKNFDNKYLSNNIKNIVSNVNILDAHLISNISIC